MKRKFVKLLIIIIFINMIICCLSCLDKWQNMGYEDYTDYTQQDLSKLKSPVILIGKVKTLGLYSITVKDSAGVIRSYGNLSIVACTIGESKNIGDTIK